MLKYVNSTPDLVLFFKKKADVSLIGFTDANFGGDLDDRKLTSGYIFLYGDISVSWCSKKQDSVSLSFIES